MVYFKDIDNIKSLEETSKTTLFHVNNTDDVYLKGTRYYEYSVENISSPTVDWNVSEVTIEFIGIKQTKMHDTVIKTEKYPIHQTIEIGKNSGIDNAMDLSNVNTEYVDLGLASGLKWAKYNIGASSDEECGAFFTWGETKGYAQSEDKYTCQERTIEGQLKWNGVTVDYTIIQKARKSGFFWENDAFNNESYGYDEKYWKTVSGDVVDSSNILKPQYDAATNIMGKGWRMPTDTDYDNLWKETNHVWTTINGVEGVKLMKKGDNSKYIFFPIKGEYEGGTLLAIDSSFAVTSRLSTKLYSRFVAQFSQSIDKKYFWVTIYDDLRYLGTPIRGVRS